MEAIDTVVIGAGHAGLAMSRCLTERGVEHIVIERGRLAERWRSSRWDSFRLLTPNWLTRLPGWSYQGDDPDGFMTGAQFADHLEGYAASFDAPVFENTTVTEVRTAATGYLVRTDRGSFPALNVVVATGYYTRAQVPGQAADLPVHLAQVTPAGYRGPSQLPEGGVLVVGASASGVQIADELRRSGRQVTLAVGRHSWLPRRYRDRDIFWWLERSGSLERTIDQFADPDTARCEPSLQLGGGGRDVGLAALQQRGVQLVGRLTEVSSQRAWFADDLSRTTSVADARLRRVLSEFDGYAARSRTRFPAAEPVPSPRITSGPDSLDLHRAGISTVVWATGLRPWYPWLTVPVLDDTGHIRHRRGVTSAPGLYAIGLRFQHRRDATFIDGARHDATYLAEHLAARRPARGRRA